MTAPDEHETAHPAGARKGSRRLRVSLRKEIERAATSSARPLKGL